MASQYSKSRPVVVWGFKSEYQSQRDGVPIASHAYIHAAYYKAFCAMGFSVQWLDDRDTFHPNVPGNAIIFCCDTRGEYLPRGEGLFYVGHNLRPEQTRAIDPPKRIALQYWLPRFKGEAVAPYSLWNAGERTLYMPWATDLLPSEIKETWCEPQTNIVYWVGSVWRDGVFGNIPEIEELEKALVVQGLRLCVVRATDERHKSYIQSSAIAPCVQGKWQVDRGYLPCRAFKNASYGQMVVTNNPAVRDLFDGQCVYADSIQEMVLLAMATCCKGRKDLSLSALRRVREAHTYVHRVETMMKVIG